MVGYFQNGGISPKGQPNVVDAAKKAQEKLQKYYPMSDGLVYVIAAIIDPHLKIEYYIDNEFGNNYIEIYKNQIKKLWESYIPNNQHEEVQNDKKPSALAPHMQKKHKHSNDDELKIFLNSSTINFDSDVLEFWKLHKIEYPHLSNMARDFLAIPDLVKDIFIEDEHDSENSYFHEGNELIEIII
ncbi:8434_t:CDS:2 [Entrophospora sp. SA101]|nr:8434_t:CDS:2 [Entrophospora sp. SA101]